VGSGVTPDQIRSFIGIFAAQLGTSIADQIAAKLGGVGVGANPGGGSGAGLSGGARVVKVRRTHPDFYKTDPAAEYVEVEATVPQLLAEMADYLQYICEAAEPEDAQAEEDEEPVQRTARSTRDPAHGNNNKQKRKR
jgi:hypothetical protein